MTKDELVERGLTTNKNGKVLDEYGNEYRDEEGCCCYLAGFVICNKTNGLYWSNKNGWVDKESSTFFFEDEKETINLPIDGEIEEIQ
jgi:hypothetical protein